MPHIRRRSGLFKQMAVPSPDQPYFKRHARSIRTKSDVIALGIDDAAHLLFFLAKDVAENTSFFLFEPSHSRAEFIENAAGHKGRCRYLRMRVLPFSAG